MQKFYRRFTVSILALAITSAFSWLVFNSFGQTVAAQTKVEEICRPQTIYVIEDNPAKTIHLVYDFSRGTISIVQIQKGYNPPEVSVRTKSLTQQ